MPTANQDQNSSEYQAMLNSVRRNLFNTPNMSLFSAPPLVGSNFNPQSHGNTQNNSTSGTSSNEEGDGQNNACTNFPSAA